MENKKKKSILKIISEFLLGFVVLLILPAIVFRIALFSIPLALAIMLFIFQIITILSIEKIKVQKEIELKKNFYIGGTQNN